MPATETTEWLIKFGKSLFPGKNECDTSMSNLKNLLKEILEERGLPFDIAMTDPRLQNPVSKCKVCVEFEFSYRL